MQFKKLAAAAMVALTCASMAASAYTVTPYAVPGSTSTQLWGINDHGVLVGSDDNGGFIDDHGTITTVNLPGSPGFVAGISNGGLAVGSDGTNSFFYQAGVLTPFAVPGADATQIRGISANGRYVTGVFDTASGDSDGFVWDDVTSTLSTIVPPAGSEFNAVQGVTDSGVAVGSLNVGGSVLFDAVDGTSDYFQYVYDLPDVRVRAIDDAGDVGGWAFDDGRIIGFLAAADAGITTFDLGAGGTYIYALNNVGEAVGFDEDADGVEHSFVVSMTAVPEPSSTILTALALLVGSVRFARRRE